MNCTTSAICEIFSGFSSHRAICGEEVNNAECNVPDEADEELGAVVAASEFGDDDKGDETDTSNSHTLHLYLLGNIWADGWAAIEKMDIRTMRKNMQEQRDRKRRLTKHMLAHVKDMCLFAHQY